MIAFRIRENLLQKDVKRERLESNQQHSDTFFTLNMVCLYKMPCAHSCTKLKFIRSQLLLVFA